MQLICIKKMSVSRKTKSVRLVIDLFKNTSNALSVIDLIDTFNGKMNKTTVYRILDRLESSGELHSFTDKDGLKRYAKSFSNIEGSNNQKNHPHFTCQDCGISSCLPIEVSAPTIPKYTINNSEHLYIGHCNECNV